MSDLISIDSISGQLRVDPLISTTKANGIYFLQVKVTDKQHNQKIGVLHKQVNKILQYLLKKSFINFYIIYIDSYITR